MQSQKMLAVCFLMLSALHSPLLHAEELEMNEPSAAVFGVALAVVAALALYVAVRIRNTLRDHLDKPAK